MATVRYIGPPSPGWRDPDRADPDDPQAEWVDDLGTSVWFPDGDRRVLVDEVVEISDTWLDLDHPDGREWPATLWQVEGGPTDRRRVGELRRELAKRNLPTTGRKDELLARLTEAERQDAHQPDDAVPQGE